MVKLVISVSKNVSGTCLAYALVAPPLILNIYNNGTLGANTFISSGSSSSSSTNPSLPYISKKFRTNSTSTNTMTTTTTATTGTSATTGSSMLFLPFNYQQALTQRCTYILNRIHMFLQFHLIENYGCDFASSGLNKESLELKLKSFFPREVMMARSIIHMYYITVVQHPF